MCTYDDADRRYPPEEHNRPCINRKLTSSSNCIAYCDFYGHRGFLNRPLANEHHCIEKGCHYYRPKPPKSKPSVTPSTNLSDFSDKIFETAQRLTPSNSGYRFINTRLDTDGIYKITYVHITNDLEFAMIADIISQEYNCIVKFIRMKCPYERATQIIFGKPY